MEGYRNRHQTDKHPHQQKRNEKQLYKHINRQQTKENKEIPSGHQTCTKQAQTQTKTKQTPIEKNFDKQTNRHQTKDT